MSRELSHERALELLPWLVNRTLHGTERAQLERHLRDCLVCRAELRSQRQLAAVVKNQPTIDWSVDQDFDALLTRIDSGDDRTTMPRRRWTGLFDYPALLFSATAAAAVLVTIAVWVGRANPELIAPETFTTLTQPGADTGVLVDIIFAPGTTETQMRALLQELDATIVAGPSDLGRYTVRAAANGSMPRDSDALLARLREDARVRFAGRSFGPDGTEAAQ